MRAVVVIAASLMTGCGLLSGLDTLVIDGGDNVTSDDASDSTNDTLSVPDVRDAAIAADANPDVREGGLEAGASCDPQHDECASGLKCCAGGAMSPDASNARCYTETDAGNCPLLP